MRARHLRIRLLVERKRDCRRGEALAVWDALQEADGAHASGDRLAARALHPRLEAEKVLPAVAQSRWDLEAHEAAREAHGDAVPVLSDERERVGGHQTDGVRLGVHLEAAAMGAAQLLSFAAHAEGNLAEVH
eukprot:m.430122 g.430122  ORF g.430122 m.430122 type:complete len:132 (-) comp17116_c0_seq1:140-535(-)